MGRHLRATLATVLRHNALRVDGQTLVRVDRNTKQTRVRLKRYNFALYISYEYSYQVMKKVKCLSGMVSYNVHFNAFKNIKS